MQVGATCVFAVEPHAAMTGNTAVHFMIDKRTELLITKRALLAGVLANCVAAHHGHVLQMAFAPFFAHWTIVRMITHQTRNHAGAKFNRGWRGKRKPCAISGRCHATHCDATNLIVLIAIHNHCALPARTHRSHRRMPAEIRQIRAHRQACLQQVLAIAHFMGDAVNVDLGHNLLIYL